LMKKNDVPLCQSHIHRTKLSHDLHGAISDLMKHKFRFPQRIKLTPFNEAISTKTSTQITQLAAFSIFHKSQNHFSQY
jgi:hypothetical protein